MEAFIYYERMTGIEPASFGWKPKVIPLYDIRIDTRDNQLMSDISYLSARRGGELQDKQVGVTGFEPATPRFQSE